MRNKIAVIALALAVVAVPAVAQDKTPAAPQQGMKSYSEPDKSLEPAPVFCLYAGKTYSRGAELDGKVCEQWGTEGLTWQRARSK